MDHKLFPGLLAKVILNPAKAWETIDSENRPVKAIRDRFLFPLAIMVSLSSIAGSLLFTNTELSPVYSILTGLRSFILLYFTVYASAFLLGEITYPLDLGKDFPVSFRLIVFSLTPFLICRVFSGVFESLLFVNVLALYGLYIFWTGADKLLTPPQYKKMPLIIATTITSAAIYFAANLLLKILVDKIYYAFFS